MNIGLRSVCWTIPFYRTCGFPGHLLSWDDLFSVSPNKKEVILSTLSIVQNER